MLRGRRWGTFVAFAAVGIVSAGAVLAQGDKESTIQARREAMKTLGKSMGAIKGYLEGKNDLAAAEQGATAIVATAGRIPEVFPQGTAMTDFPGKTGAKPAIWAEWDKFNGSQKALASEGQKLVDLLKTGDKEKIGAQFAAVGKNGCGSCHNSYRQKLD